MVCTCADGGEWIYWIYRTKDDEGEDAGGEGHVSVTPLASSPVMTAGRAGWRKTRSDRREERVPVGLQCSHCL